MKKLHPAIVHPATDYPAKVHPAKVHPAKVHPAKVHPAMSFALLVLIAACGNGDTPPINQEAQAPDATTPETPLGAERTTPPLAPEQEEFWDNLASFCGRAFAGEATNMREGDTRRHGLYADREFVAHFRQCFDDELRIAGHIDDDRSRTWLVTRIEGGLDLRHDHRREDGSDDSQTMYGASTSGPGSPLRQEFTRNGGFWMFELVPGERFSYGNHDGEAWLVRFDFDLNRPVPPPQAPWGYEETEAHPPPVCSGAPLGEQARRRSVWPPRRASVLPAAAPPSPPAVPAFSPSCAFVPCASCSRCASLHCPHRYPRHRIPRNAGPTRTAVNGPPQGRPGETVGVRGTTTTNSPVVRRPRSLFSLNIC